MHQNYNLFSNSQNIGRRDSLEREEFEEELKQQLPILFEVMEQAFVQTKKELEDKGESYRTRNLSSTLMNSNIKGKLHEYGFQVKSKDGRFSLTPENKYLIYFKKLNEDGLPMNIPSKRNEMIMRQLCFEGMEEPIPIIFIGYQTNSSFDNLDRVIAVNITDNKKVNWYSDLEEIYYSTKSSDGKDEKQEQPVIKLKSEKDKKTG